MTIKTDQLIPGEYYWVKISERDDWEPGGIWRFGGLLLFRNQGAMKPEEVHAIFCDKSGNPIPIKRPE